MIKSVASKIMRRTPILLTSRPFSHGIDSEQDQSAGRRRQELEAEKEGKIAFNRDPIIPPSNAGTKENPILVPSGEESRAVGFEDPNSHQLQWFNLHKGSVHFVPTIGLYFKLHAI